MENGIDIPIFSYEEILKNLEKKLKVKAERELVAQAYWRME